MIFDVRQLIKRMNRNQQLPSCLVIQVSNYFKILLSNQFIAYGKCGEQVTKHHRFVVTQSDDQVSKLMRKPTFIGVTSLVDEEDDECAMEVEMRKKRVIDSKPIHYNIAILQWSKLLFLRYNFLQRLCITNY